MDAERSATRGAAHYALVPFLLAIAVLLPACGGGDTVRRDAPSRSVAMPRTSRDLAAAQGPRIAPERLAAADLVFFGAGGTVTHVGIYVGEGRFVHAPSTGGTVRLDHLDGPYWSSRYSGARRVLR